MTRKQATQTAASYQEPPSKTSRMTGFARSAGQEKTRLKNNKKKENYITEWRKKLC